MHLIFYTARLENFMTAFKDIIKFISLIILFGKISSSESLSLSGTESETKRLTDFERFSVLYSLKSKVPVADDRNCVSHK